MVVVYGQYYSKSNMTHLAESLPLAHFRRNLKRPQSRIDEFDNVLPGHANLDSLPLPCTIINELISGIEKILNGERGLQRENIC
ncbi:hypothetical protein KEJ33_05320 [Candidatus Bathyarchaeota archaeon]|nr:hypothetical protein [Candidatus Bathyarchaeota archaeon]